jgi:DSF synthase
MLNEAAHLAIAAQEANIPIDFWVTGSAVPGLYNVGGDLSYFIQCIRAGDRTALLAYAHAGAATAYQALTGFGVGAISIAMVEGTALGGGFEAALAHEFVLAQKGAKLGFPEIAFNMYPGMGAYSLVARKAHSRLAEQLISTGETFSAEWHAEKGLVDHLFEPGNAYFDTREFIDRIRAKLNGIKGMLRARRRVLPVTEAELNDIAENWVDAAFQLGEKDLAYMEQLVALQDKRISKATTAPVLATKTAASETEAENKIIPESKTEIAC